MKAQESILRLFINAIMNTLAELFFTFAKIGCFTFGGGYAMIPLMRQVVLKYEWATENEFYNW